MISVHPRGRFITVEYVVHAPLDGSVRLQESILTPECDERGLLRDEDLKPPPIDLSDEEKRDTPKKKKKLLCRAEKLEIERRYMAGETIKSIARRISRSTYAVRKHLASKGWMMQ